MHLFRVHREIAVTAPAQPQESLADTSLGVGASDSIHSRSIATAAAGIGLGSGVFHRGDGAVVVSLPRTVDGLIVGPGGSSDVGGGATRVEQSDPIGYPLIRRCGRLATTRATS
jgi:hypothetical protein